ncbi:unnamed protein product [Penicillium egyptiacum]|uniref:Integral membrane protein n=1 Tax=Penicillium egyptiacum TaxID=1303716 RepID=A0A9W4KL16_9EURO|nr:unnamed protein product [Penicillium egyptiacum]
MDSFDLSKAPLEFQEWTNTSVYIHLYTNVTWVIVYVGLIQRSIQDRSYAMPLFSQCFNIAWEITFGFIFPTDDWGVTAFFQLAVIINSVVTYTGIRYGSREWDHAPMVKRNLPMIYAAGIGTSLACYMGIAKQFGRTKACFMIAIILQAILSVGSLSQLLTRGSTRGFSFSLWFLRFTGSLALVPEFYLRVQHWHEDFGFLASPLMLWCCYIFLGFDLVYGVCFWYIKQYEQGGRMAQVQKKQ